ncbi:MAG: hypothetical protein ACK5ML_05310 [Lachnospiraceae bacterium]
MPKEIMDGLHGISSEYDDYCLKKMNENETPMTFLYYVADLYKKPTGTILKQTA